MLKNGRRNSYRGYLWLALPSALLIYSYWVEPIWIEISRHSVKTGLNLQRAITIAHVSDLHIRSMGYRETQILSILDQEKPDAVFITGDSISDNANYQALGGFLEKIRAPRGVWLVRGNWEHWRPSQEEQEAYQSSGVRLLDNSAAHLGDGVWVVGIDDEYAGHPDVRTALEHVDQEGYKIGLFHSPAFFDKAFDRFDLVLTGHTHGGQVRLPLLPPLWLPEGSGDYVAGWYTKGETEMYVSRGLGNSVLDIRLFCRPEISIIELR